MAAVIDVEKLKNGDFQVRVIEGASSSNHRVRLTDSDYQRLCRGKIAPDELVKRSFEFLLTREPKESILPEFDLPLIGRYFSEYERELQRMI